MPLPYCPKKTAEGVRWLERHIRDVCFSLPVRNPQCYMKAYGVIFFMRYPYTAETVRRFA
jgi:hypothetical protein